jgi:hypothetical protein
MRKVHRRLGGPSRIGLVCRGSRLVASGHPIEVARMRITEAGRGHWQEAGDEETATNQTAPTDRHDEAENATGLSL